MNRTYEDFKTYVSNNPSLPIIEIDIVEGIKGGKVFLTLYFRESKLMFAYLRNHDDSASVINIFNQLEEQLGLNIFQNFPLLY